jgi:sensor histidine kinase YesM
MLLSEVLFAGITYFTTFLYKRLFEATKYRTYFLVGATSWILYLCGRTVFQFYYLRNAPGFKNNSFADILINNLTVVIVCFLFITACKYFKDGYIRQHFEAEKKEQQLLAEVNNLKSQIAPHFLFNTLNNLYGLAVEKSDKLPDLMLRLSDLLRHSLYETQKPLVPIADEMAVIKSYIELESIRLEDNLKLSFENSIPANEPHLIAPLILIVFIENAFKHAKLVQSEPVNIVISSRMRNEWFELILRNNYKKEKAHSTHGIGLTNVMRRLEVLYPSGAHNLVINKDENFYTVKLQVRLTKKTEKLENGIGKV